MAIQFGKTWWGEHWLRSLQNDILVQQPDLTLRGGRQCVEN